MNAIESAYNRRSIRKYKDMPVEREKIETLMKVAMAAPSGVNTQPWHFCVVESKDKLQGLMDSIPNGKQNPPCAIVVCGNMEGEKSDVIEKYWVQDCTAALENILNAAPDLGLGTVWLGVYPIEERVKGVSEYLGLPKNIVPLAVLILGYPDEEKEPRTQYDERKVQYF